MPPADPPPPGGPPRLPWRHRLAVRLNLTLVLLALGLLCGFSWVLLTQGRAILHEEAVKLADQTGNKLVSDLGQRLARTETLTATLTELFTILGTDGQHLRRVIPALLNQMEQDTLLAGGGLWPAPDRGDPALAWNRGTDGVLRELPPNETTGAPPHAQEPWYVAARHSETGKAVWSGAYLDPYTGQPMVTCAMAARDGQGNLLGVATVDLNLEGLQEFFRQGTAFLESYAFAVDPHNRFISYPDPQLVTRPAGTASRTFLSASGLAKKDARFTPVATRLAAVNDRLLERPPYQRQWLGRMADDMARQSPRLTQQDALVTAAVVTDTFENIDEGNTFLESLPVPEDPVLGEPAHAALFHVPGAYWKVVLVTPQRVMMRSVTATARWLWAVSALFLGGTIAVVVLLLRLSVTGPLARMTRQLEHQDGGGPPGMLKAPPRGELGLLAWWFNRRTGEWTEALGALQKAKEGLEERVAERTQELSSANEQLKQEIADRIKAEEEKDRLHKELVATSRTAGMAEVATGVLHNVGNVLNSLNVSVSVLTERGRKSKVDNLEKAAAMLREHRDDLARFITEDPKGQQLLDYLLMVSEHLSAARRDDLEELDQLARNLEHVKQIVSQQQSYAKVSGVLERVAPAEVMTYALQINAADLARHEITVEKDLADLPEVLLDKQKILQILVNLVSNARDALAATDRKDRTLSVALRPDEDGALVYTVTDIGEGIAEENLVRIFTMGFTTKPHGHGFGLHAAALAAQEMGGSLQAHSDGPGRGATFTLTVPVKTPPSPSGEGPAEPGERGGNRL